MPASPSDRSDSAAVNVDAPIPLSRPDVSALERRYVMDVLDSPRLALGPRLEAFEAAMADRCGTRHAVAVSSGTAALHCIVRALGLGPGDEVLTTPYSFVASSNALLFEGARPRFVDVDPATYNLDVDAAADAIGPDTRGILAVDVFGTPADWPALTALAEAHDLVLIDDACEALGASTGGRAVGAWGDAASFGFYPNKQITTGEGGCITTDDDDLAAVCRSLRNQGRADDGAMRHVRLGFNYRLDELSAALGCAQLERLDALLDARARVARWYTDALDPLTDDLVLPSSSNVLRPSESKSAAPSNTQRSWFVYVVRLRDHFDADARDRLLDVLRDAGIGCAPYFPAIHLQPYYREQFGYTPGDLPMCEHVAARTLALPFFAALPRDAVARVADVLSDALDAVRT